jgi:hypothetical protein
VEQKLRVLLADAPREVSLDRLGAVIGDERVDTEQVDALIVAIEAAGVPVVSEFGAGVAPLLRRVLEVARTLRARGEPIAPSAIARAANLSLREVRVGLLYAEVLQGD